MKSAKKPEAAAASKEKKIAAAGTKTAAVKAEAAPRAEASSKAGAVSKAAAPKSVAASKTEAASKAPAKKPAAKKAAAKKPVAKTAAKSSAKTASKTAAKTPAKKTAKKAPAVTIDTICEKLDKKITKSKAAAIKGRLAVDIEVWGFEDGSNARMYVEVNDGKVTVAPYPYDAKDFRVSLSFANAKAFVDGKLTLKALLDSNDFYAEGNIVSAVKLAAIF